MEQSKIHFYETGEKPPNGVYVCANCGRDEQYVPQLVTELPICRYCRYNYWVNKRGNDG